MNEKDTEKTKAILAQMPPDEEEEAYEVDAAMKGLTVIQERRLPFLKQAVESYVNYPYFEPNPVASSECT
jgi:hypothetical protein